MFSPHVNGMPQVHQYAEQRVMGRKIAWLWSLVSLCYYFGQSNKWLLGSHLSLLYSPVYDSWCSHIQALFLWFAVLHSSWQRQCSVVGLLDHFWVAPVSCYWVQNGSVSRNIAWTVELKPWWLPWLQHALSVLLWGTEQNSKPKRSSSSK